MLYQILVYTIQGKKSYKDDKFNISAPTWNDNLNYLLDHVLYQLLSDIQGYFDYFIKKHEYWLLIWW